MINRIQYLDGLRAISIIMVLIGHGAHSFYSATWFSFIGNSHLGVMIFFNISGFLITTLLLKEITKTDSINLLAFYIRRSLRIFPVFYTYILIIALLTYFGLLNVVTNDFFYASTYLWNYKAALSNSVESKDIWYLGHFWTLALEEQFYLFWPFALYLFGIKKTMNVLPFFLLSFPLFRLASYIFMPELRGQIGMMLHTMSDSILWGGYAAMLLFYNKEYLISKLNLYNNKAIFISMLIFLFIGSKVFSLIFKGAYSITIGLTIEAILISSLILYLVVLEPKEFSFINNRYVVYLGTLSYSLYIWQQLFLANEPSSLVFAFPLNYILCFVVAYISYNTIERFGLYIKSKM